MTNTTIKSLNRSSQKRLLDELKRDIFTNINCINIGQIESFDPSNQSASIKILLKSIESIDTKGVRKLKEKPVILQCPCMILSGGGSHLTFPITKGDECIVLFNDREIDNWFKLGGTQTPTTLRKHDLSDAFAIVGISSVVSSLQDYFSNGVRLAFDSSSKIEFSQGKAELTAATNIINGNEILNGNGTINGNEIVNGNITASGTIQGGSLIADDGADGVFTASGFVWTVTSGIITGKVPVP